MCLFKKKTLVKVIYLGEQNISKDDKNFNLVVGHMMDRFDGVVAADVYNSTLKDRSVFKLFYSDGSTKIVKVCVGSKQEEYYFDLEEKFDL